MEKGLWVNAQKQGTVVQCQFLVGDALLYVILATGSHS